jgi:Protein of unknown function (DUF2384)
MACSCEIAISWRLLSWRLCFLLVAVLEQLSGVLRPQAAHDWLFTPNPSLEHHKPVDLLRTGDFRQVLGAIDVCWTSVIRTHAHLCTSTTPR